MQLAVLIEVGCKKRINCLRHYQFWCTISGRFWIEVQLPIKNRKEETVEARPIMDVLARTEIGGIAQLRLSR